MLSKTILALTLAALAAAVPTAYEPQGPSGGDTSVQGDSCGAGSTVHCCDAETAKKVSGKGLLPIDADLENLLGQCNDITVAVLGGAVPLNPACSQQAVCCGKTSQNGLVNLGCTPISL